MPAQEATAEGPSVNAAARESAVNGSTGVPAATAVATTAVSTTTAVLGVSG